MSASRSTVRGFAQKITRAAGRARLRPRDTRSWLRTTPTVGAAVLLVLNATLPADASSFAPGLLTVNPRPGCAASQSRTFGVSSGRPWCTIAGAAKVVQPRDSVMIATGVYPGTVALGPGATDSTWTAAPDVVIDARGAASGLTINGADGVRVSNLVVRGARTSNVWVYGADDVTLSNLTSQGSSGLGLQVRDTQRLTVDSSSFSGNTLAGVREAPDAMESTYRAVTVDRNGRDGRPYNGDGMQLAGTDTLVDGSTVSNNGDHDLYEHGIYFAASATGWLVQDTTVAGNSAAAVKAQGPGRLQDVTLSGGRLGVYVDALEPRTAVVLSGVRFSGQRLYRVQTGVGGRVQLYSGTPPELVRTLGENQRF